MTAFPDSWWRDRPLIFGHRGASALAPQNTLAAFRKAAEMGADGVELDVHLSAEGVPVVIHDARVDRTTDGSGLIMQMPLTQIKALDAGGWFAPEFAGERVPTLEEVLAEFGDRLLINIEIKPEFSKGTELEATVAALVQYMGMADRVWFSSFRPYSLYQLRQFAPEVPCGFLYGWGTLLSSLLKPVTPFEALHPESTFVTERLVRRAHQRGLRVVTWTLDDEARARQFSAWGVDGIITNDPGRLLAVLNVASQGCD